MILQAQNITKTIGLRTLFDIPSLQIPEHARIGIIGKNGSGKTTLLELLAIQAFDGYGYVLPQMKESEIEKSGGEMTWLAVVAAFNQTPDILFADEPTTHLDAGHIDKLIRKVKQFSGSFVCVSHDRYFLNQVCTEIWELADGIFTQYSGDYDFYRHQKEIKQEQEQVAYDEYVKKQHQLTVARQIKEQKSIQMVKTPSKRMGTTEARKGKVGAAARQKKILRSRKALLTRMEQLEKVEKPKTQTALKMNIANQQKVNGKVIVRCTDVVAQINNKVLWRAQDFQLFGGDHVAIIGDNGSGKTTFIRMLLQSTTGMQLSTSAKVGYFSQNLADLDKTKTVLETVMSTTHNSESTVRTVLARLNFYEEDMKKQVLVLSGGEQVKLAFAKLFLSDINMLIMDEPTNFLDLEAVEALESLLQEYAGTIIFVSHDRTFVDTIATKILRINAGNLALFEGSLNQVAKSDTQAPREPSQDQLLVIETKLAEVISRLSLQSTPELEAEFTALLKAKQELKKS